MAAAVLRVIVLTLFFSACLAIDTKTKNKLISYLPEVLSHVSGSPFRFLQGKEPEPANKASLKHTITMVGTLPPEWLMPGVEHLRHGVDIVTGSEASRPLFHFTYGGVDDPYDSSVTKTKAVNTMQMPGVGSAGQVFWYPDQLVGKPYESCEFSSTSSTFASVSSFSSAMALSAGVEIAVAGIGAMSASASASAVKSGLRNGKRRLFMNKAQCLTASLTNMELASLHPQFVTDLAALPKDFPEPAGKQGAYFEFFRNYGTHFYKTSDLGGQLSQMTFVDSSVVSEQSVSAVAAEVTGSFSVGIAKGSGHSKAESSSGSGSSTSSSHSSSTTTAFGGEPGAFSSSAADSGVSWGSWAQTIPMNPVPLNFKLAPFSKLPKAALGGREQALAAAMRAYLVSTSKPWASTYTVYALFQDQCHEIGCAAQAPPPPKSWQPLMAVKDVVAQGLVGQAKGSVAKGLLAQKGQGADGEVDSSKFKECTLVCSKGSSDCTRPDGGLVLLKHKGAACTASGCGSDACKKEVTASGRCAAQLKACKGSKPREATAEEVAAAPVKPTASPVVGSYAPCDFACRMSNGLSSKQCRKDGALVTVSHRGPACAAGKCSGKKCEAEVFLSGVCKQTYPTCDSKHVSLLTATEIKENEAIKEANKQGACALVCRHGKKDCTDAAGALRAVVAFKGAQCVPGKCDSNGCKKEFAAATGKCPAECDGKSHRSLPIALLQTAAEAQGTRRHLRSAATISAAATGGAGPSKAKRLFAAASAKALATVGHAMAARLEHWPPTLKDSPPQNAADLSTLQEYPTLTVQGSRGRISQWKLGVAQKHPFVYGKMFQGSREVPNIGDITNITLSTGDYTFRFLRIFSETDATEYIFDTRGPVSSKQGSRNIFQRKPLLLPGTGQKQLMHGHNFVRAPFYKTLQHMFASKRNRYEFMIESTSSRYIDTYGDVTVLLTGHGGSLSVPAPFYQEKFWALIGGREEIADQIDRGLAEPGRLQAASADKNLRFANFATDNGPVVSFFSYEGMDIGELKSVTLQLSRMPGAPMDDIALAPWRQQKAVAVGICRALLNVGGPPTDVCGDIQSPGMRKNSIPNLDELAANYDYEGIDQKKCAQVIALMETGGPRYSCKFDQAKHRWDMYEPAVGDEPPNSKRMGSLLNMKPGCRYEGSANARGRRDDCDALFPEGSPIFTLSEGQAGSDAKSRLLAVRRVKVSDFKHRSARVAQFNTQVSSRSPVKRNLL